MNPRGNGQTDETCCRDLRQRGMAEQNIKEGENTIRLTRLSSQKFGNNVVRLQLHTLAYSLGSLLRTLALPKAMEQ